MGTIMITDVYKEKFFLSFMVIVRWLQLLTLCIGIKRQQ